MNSGDESLDVPESYLYTVDDNFAAFILESYHRQKQRQPRTGAPLAVFN